MSKSITSQFQASYMRSRLQSKSIIFFMFLIFSFCLHSSSLMAEKTDKTHVEAGRVSGAFFQWIVSTELSKNVVTETEKHAKKIPLNKMIILDIEAKSLTDTKVNHTIELLEFDARMPDHNHGMNTRPQVKVKDSLHWTVEGVNLHMKGVWEFILKIKVDGKSETLSFKKSIDA